MGRLQAVVPTLKGDDGEKLCLALSHDIATFLVFTHGHKRECRRSSSGVYSTNSNCTHLALIRRAGPVSLQGGTCVCPHIGMPIKNPHHLAVHAAVLALRYANGLGVEATMVVTILERIVIIAIGVWQAAAALALMFVGIVSVFGGWRTVTTHKGRAGVAKRIRTSFAANPVRFWIRLGCRIGLGAFLVALFLMRPYPDFWWYCWMAMTPFLVAEFVWTYRELGSRWPK